MNPPLTKKQWLGIIWEIATQMRLDGIVEYEGNPTHPEEWKSKIAAGSDIKIPSLGVETECKFTNYLVYPSHIKSCYIDRFKHDTKHKWICTNDKTKYTLAARNTLDEENIKLLYPFEIEARIFRMLFDMMKGSNYVKPTSLVKDIILKLCYMVLVSSLEFKSQFNKGFRKRLWLILHGLSQDTMVLISTMFHVKHTLRIKLNDPSSTGFLSIPSITSEYNASSPLYSITPLFYINQSSIEFYHTGTSGVHWLQEYNA